ncbi:MAG: hypothetical protein WKG32_13900 [Gemmatimonadaceae bacterium]
MIRRPNRDIAALLLDRAVLDCAVARARAEAVRRHRLLGQPIATWRDGRVVIEIPPPEEKTETVTPDKDGA